MKKNNIKIFLSGCFLIFLAFSFSAQAQENLLDVQSFSEEKIQETENEKPPDLDNEKRSINLESGNGDQKELVKKIEVDYLKDNWKSSENPSFSFPEFRERSFFEKIKNLFVEENLSDFEISFQDSQGKQIGMDIENYSFKKDGDFELEILETEKLKPGKYTIIVKKEEGGEIFEAKYDFTWGVLAVNFNKSVYVPGETVYVQMGVLDDQGSTICNADLELFIKNKKTKKETILSTKEKTISYSGKCLGNNVTDTPDYFAHFQTDEKEAEYEVRLKAITENGEREMTDAFSSSEKIAFDVERIAPTRIYPLAKYPVKMIVSPEENFKGKIFEKVPKDFDITESQDFEVVENEGDEYKRIVWQVDWAQDKNRSQKYELQYEFDAPDISPFLFLLGPLEAEKENSSGITGIFKKNKHQTIENRQWQIASDDPATQVYYSVSPFGTGDIKTGSPTISIASGVATLSVAQTGNIGVGVKITYNATSVAYISRVNSTTSFNVITAVGGTPGNVSGQTVNSIAHPFASLSAAEAGATGASYLNTSNLSTGNYVLNIPCYYDHHDGTADTTAVTIDGYTTSATNYIKIYTPQGGSESINSQRQPETAMHYKLTNISATTMAITAVNNIIIEGLNISNQSVTSEHHAINSYNSDNITVKNSGLVSTVAGGYKAGIRFYIDSALTATYTVENSSMIGFYRAGINTVTKNSAANLTLNMVSNTIFNCGSDGTGAGVRAYYDAGTHHINSFNNLVVGNRVDFQETNAAVTWDIHNSIGSDNTINSLDGSAYGCLTNRTATDSDSPGAGDWVVFEDITTLPYDLRLKSNAENDAQDAHTDSSGAGMTMPSTDAVGTSRPYNTYYDIGSFEIGPPVPVYYSVSPYGTGDIKTGSPTISISSGVATLSVAQTGNIGVGVKITYNTTSVAYISKVNSTTSFDVITAVGGTPGNVSGQTVNSIAHPFASISAAEAGATGASYLNTSNLVTGNYILNIPCYYDHDDGTADTTAVTIDGYTTGEDNYIKIYTPQGGTESNNSQRHPGYVKASPDYYNIRISSATEMAFRIDGIQRAVIDGIEIQSNENTLNAWRDNFSLISVPVGAVYDFKNCLISTSVNGATSHQTGISIQANSSGVVNVENTVIAGLSRGGIVYHSNTSINLTINVNSSSIYGNGLSSSETFIGGIAVGRSGTSPIVKVNIFNSSLLENSTDLRAIGSGATGIQWDIHNSIDSDGSITDRDASAHSYLENRTATDSDSPGAGDWVVFQNITTLPYDLRLKSNAENDAQDAHTDSSGAGMTMPATDIVGTSRPQNTNYDIGSFEIGPPVPVYYSVSPYGTGDIKTGSPTISISSGVATLSVAQTGNIGVGVKITYNTTSVAYISKVNSTTSFNVITAVGGTPGNVSGQTVNSIAHPFASISAAEAGATGASYLNTSNLVTGNYILNIPCYYDHHDGTTDSTAVTIDGYTTGVSSYIKIYTPQGGSESINNQRHSGVWNSNLYVLETSSTNRAIYIQDLFVRIEGMQIKSADAETITVGNGAANGESQISHSIIRSANDGIGIRTNNVHTSKVWNTIIILSGNNYLHEAIHTEDTGAKTLYAYNLTIYAPNATGAVINSTTTTGYFKNCLIQAGQYGFRVDTGNAGTYNVNYCVTSDGTGDDFGGSGNKVNQTASFVNAAGGDFRLMSSDTVALNSGADLSSDSYLSFSDDILNVSRPQGNFWDIGAFEGGVDSTPVYYSVSPFGTGDIKTGSPTISIASGVATLSVAQTGNIGVGVKITYNTTSVAYISRVNSATSFNVITATGGTPGNVSGQTVNSIAHPFASISAAEAGATGASYLNTSNLVTGNYILNIPCYYDHHDGTTDSTAVTIDGYTTSATNYIKIYTPQGGTESINNQRHSGMWTDYKYRLQISNASAVVANVDFVRFEGLQVRITSVNANSQSALDISRSGSNNREIHISQNIFRGVTTASSNYHSGIRGNLIGTGVVILKIWNNLIYDFYGYNNFNYNGGRGINLFGDVPGPGHVFYVYNNTIYNSFYGIRSYYSTYFKNNVVHNCDICYKDEGSLFHSSSTHNISSDATAPAYGTYYRNATVSFVNAAGGDFHLSLADTVARNAGTMLCDDANLSFSTDIDGQSRVCAPNVWDIGADQVPAQVMIEVHRNVNFRRGVNFKGK